MAPVLEQSMAAGLASDPMVPRPFRIQRRRQETADTFTVDLVPADERETFSFAPGQFNMLYVFGVGEVPISISGDPSGSAPLQHTTRVVGSITRAMRQLKRGDTIGIRGPFGSRWPIGEATGRDCLIVTGGIGLAPLRPVLYHVMAHREDFRRIVLLYGARTSR